MAPRLALSPFRDPLQLSPCDIGPTGTGWIPHENIFRFLPIEVTRQARRREKRRGKHQERRARGIA